MDLTVCRRAVAVVVVQEVVAASSIPLVRCRRLRLKSVLEVDGGGGGGGDGNTTNDTAART